MAGRFESEGVSEMSDHQKPWDSTKPYDEYTDIEKVFLWAYDDLFTGHAAVVERAWAALCDKCKDNQGADRAE